MNPETSGALFGAGIALLVVQLVRALMRIGQPAQRTPSKAWSAGGHIADRAAMVNTYNQLAIDTHADKTYIYDETDGTVWFGTESWRHAGTVSMMQFPSKMTWTPLENRAFWGVMCFTAFRK